MANSKRNREVFDNRSKSRLLRPTQEMVGDGCHPQTSITTSYDIIPQQTQTTGMSSETNSLTIFTERAPILTEKLTLQFPI